MLQAEPFISGWSKTAYSAKRKHKRKPIFDKRYHAAEVVRHQDRPFFECTPEPNKYLIHVNTNNPLSTHHSRAVTTISHTTYTPPASHT